MKSIFAAKKRVVEDEFDFKEDVEEFAKLFVFSNFFGPVLIDGPWGSGKTSFVNFLVEEIHKHKRRYKVSYISVWELPNNTNMYEIAFRLVFKKLYWLLNLAFVPVSLIPTIVLLYSTTRQDWLAQTPMFIIVTVSSFIIIKEFILINDNRNGLYYALLKSLLNHVFTKRRVVIVDDLDRLDQADQKKIYPVISVLFGKKVKLLLLADYQKLAYSNEPFIQKIINTKFTITNRSNPERSWSYFTDYLRKIASSSELETTIDQTDAEEFTEIRELFIKESRTIRDAIILVENLRLYYFNYKSNIANLGQFLAMSYFYTFNTRLYGYILDNRDSFTSAFGIGLTLAESRADLLRSVRQEFGEKFPNYSSIVLDTLFEISLHGTRNRRRRKYPSISDVNGFNRYKMVLSSEFYDQSGAENAIRTAFVSVPNTKQNPENLKTITQFIESDDMKLISDKELRKSLFAYAKRFFKYEIQSIDAEKGFLNTAESEQLLISFIKEFTRRKLDYREYLISICGYRKLDVSQICFILPKFTTQQDEQIEILKAIIGKNLVIDVMKLKFIKYFVLLYKPHYSYLHTNQIDESFMSIFKLSDSKFVNFISSKLTFVSYELGSNTPKPYVDIESISFNDEFRLNMQLRISSIKNREAKEKMDILINNHWL